MHFHRQETLLAQNVRRGGAKWKRTSPRILKIEWWGVRGMTEGLSYVGSFFSCRLRVFRMATYIVYGTYDFFVFLCPPP